MTYEPVLGIDPGTTGALALLNTGVTSAGFSPEMSVEAQMDLLRKALNLLVHFGGRHVFMEKVQYIGKRKNGQKGDGAQGAFTFGRLSGVLEGGLHMAEQLAHRGVEIHMVPPMLWQAKLGCLSGGNKNVTKRKAQELWPEAQAGFKWTHQISDAALIARYGQVVLAEAAVRRLAATPVDPLAEG